MSTGTSADIDAQFGFSSNSFGSVARTGSHHFGTTEAARLLTTLFALSRSGLIVNDLHRHPIAYWATKIGSSVMSRSYMVRHDGPISVQRGFTRADLVNLAAASGFRWTLLQWRWAFRYLAVACKSPNSPAPQAAR
jgi:hypothetical protein